MSTDITGDCFPFTWFVAARINDDTFTCFITQYVGVFHKRAKDKGLDFDHNQQNINMLLL